MLEIYLSEEGRLIPCEEMVEGCWVRLTDPTDGEIDRVARTLDIEIDMLNAARDIEESARIEVEGATVLTVVDIPTVDLGEERFAYTTIPLGIIKTSDHLVTVCTKDTHVLRDFAQGRVRGFSTRMKTRFIFQILYRIAARFLLYLKQIDKATDLVERALHKSMKNKELIELMELQKSLVYFSTSLKGNEIAMEKLMRTTQIRKFPEDEDLLEDVLIENKQAIEMCTIYRDILSSTMDAFASIISNNVNEVMKILTSLTIVLSIPTLVASLWGMNVRVPFADSPWGFVIVMACSFVISGVSAFLLHRRKMF